MTTTTVPARPRRFDWQRLVFLLTVVMALTLLGLNGLLLLQSDWFSGIFNQNLVAGAASHFKTLNHRIHDVSFGLLYGTGAVGLLTQLRSPRANVTGMFTAMVPWAALGLVYPLTKYWVPFGTTFQLSVTAIFGGLTLSAVLLHPAGRDLRRSFQLSQMNPVMVGLLVVAALPLFVFTTTNISLQREIATGDIHWQLGHFGFMAALSLTIIAVGAVACLQPLGWRISAWVAGLLPAMLGALSLVYRDQSSSLGAGWSLAAIVWGGAFVASAERVRTGQCSRLAGLPWPAYCRPSQGRVTHDIPTTSASKPRDR